MSQLTTIDLETLTVTEKIGLMEALWRDISKEPEDVEVPEWHIRILEERERALKNGEDEFIDFEVAMAEMREQINARQTAK
jgi:hypothetical protein